MKLPYVVVAVVLAALILLVTVALPNNVPPTVSDSSPSPTTSSSTTSLRTTPSSTETSQKTSTGFTTTQTTSLTGNSENASLLDGLGLRLSLSVNATEINTGQEIIIGVEVINTLHSENNISIGSDWRWPEANLTLVPALECIFPGGVTLLRGYYTQDNISSASSGSLFLAPLTGTAGCGPFSAGYYLFKPTSEYAQPGPNITEFLAVSGTLTTNGYWTGSYSHPGTFHPFDPGLYTIVGVDEWGDMVLLPFNAG